MTARNEPKPASPFTTESNIAAAVSFDDPGDFGRATRGLIAQLESGRVTVGDHVVYDVEDHRFVTEGDAPDTVHPGLWRQAQLNWNHGLFEVADGVWQVRGYDVSNITFIAGETGWLIIDPLTSAPAAAAALDLANRTLGERPGRVSHLHPLPRRPLRRCARRDQPRGGGARRCRHRRP